MRLVNIIPTQNSEIKLPDWEISSPAFNVLLSNEDIYKCINQKGLVYEIINGTQILITLDNIKNDLAQEAALEAEAKKTEIEKLNVIIENLRRQITDIKEDHIFSSMEDAIVYATSPLTAIGEIITVLTVDRSEYLAYVVEPDRSLLPISSDESTQAQFVLDKVNALNTGINTATDKINLLESQLITLSDNLQTLKTRKTSFDTLDTAKTFALDEALSYTGEIITVKAGIEYAPYIINTDRTITELVAGSKITVIQ